jgi:uncharacterized membrane protein (DUF106 family)
MAQIINLIMQLPSVVKSMQTILTILGSGILIFIAQKMFRKFIKDQSKIANEQKKIDQQNKIEDETKKAGEDYNKSQDDIRNSFHD